MTGRPRKPRVLILAGGLSHERDVSLRSGRRAADALRATGLEVEIHDVDARLLDTLDQVRPDVVWPLLHGSVGEDGSLKDVLDLVGVPYIGSDPRASRAAWSKPVAKTSVHRAGVATPDFVTLPQSLFRELGASRVLEAVVDRLGLPLVVKPTHGGSALGVSFVTDAADLPRAMVECFSYWPVALIERAVIGTEVAVSVIDTGDGPRALPAVEIVTEGAYDYDARYNPGRAQYFAPARLIPELSAAAAETAIAAHTTLDLRHLSRTDIIIDEAGTPWFLEASVVPGTTETSLFPLAIDASGQEQGAIYRALVEAAVTH